MYALTWKEETWIYMGRWSQSDAKILSVVKVFLVGCMYNRMQQSYTESYVYWG
jgi:hypothetical protein